MKTDRLLVLAAALIIPTFAAVAAPVESGESGRAIAQQKIAAFLSEQAVAQRLTALGLNRSQVDAQLAKLSDAQLEQMAGQIDQVRAGGDIQGGGAEHLGPIGCMLAPLGRFMYDLYQLVFCWGTLR